MVIRVFPCYYQGYNLMFSWGKDMARQERIHRMLGPSCGGEGDTWDPRRNTVTLGGLLIVNYSTELMVLEV